MALRILAELVDLEAVGEARGVVCWHFGRIERAVLGKGGTVCYGVSATNDIRSRQPASPSGCGVSAAATPVRESVPQWV